MSYILTHKRYDLNKSNIAAQRCFLLTASLRPCSRTLACLDAWPCKTVRGPCSWTCEAPFGTTVPSAHGPCQPATHPSSLFGASTAVPTAHGLFTNLLASSCFLCLCVSKVQTELSMFFKQYLIS